MRTGEAAQLIRRLVDHIDAIPGAERGQFELTAYGSLAELTAITTAKKRSANKSSVSLVAGEGFEPPTLGL